MKKLLINIKLCKPNFKPLLKEFIPKGIKVIIMNYYKFQMKKVWMMILMKMIKL